MSKKEATQPVISNEKLAEITLKLKACCSSWTTVMSDRMSNTKEWKNWSKNPCDGENVRMISKGGVKRNEHRILFAKVAAQIILEKAQEAQEAQELIDKI